jgi:hypothetical protein
LFLTADIDYVLRGSTITLVADQAALVKVNHRVTVKYKIQDAGIGYGIIEVY